MNQLAEKEISREQQKPDEVEFPEELAMPLSEVDQYFELWATWRMTGKKFTLRQILDEPDRAWAVVNEIDYHYESLLQIHRNQANNNG